MFNTPPIFNPGQIFSFINRTGIQTTTFVPEALHRLVEVYLILGVKEEAIVNARVLGYNYPDSKWYKLSYQLLKKNKILIQKN